MDTATFMEIMSVNRHDFLNHMQVISGFIQLNKIDRVKEYINQISHEIEKLSKINRLTVPEVAAALQVGHYLAGRHQVEVIYDINTTLEGCTIPGSMLGEVLEEVFRQSLTCLAPPGVPNRYLKVSVNETDKKIFFRITFPVLPEVQADDAQTCLAEVGNKIASYGGKVGMVVSESGGETFIVFQRRLLESHASSK